MAYMASMPELKLDIETQKRLTRSENQFTANQVATSDKLYGFFSLNPISDYALEEANYWIKTGGFHGLKLHLANADIDLFNPNHVQKIQDLFKVVDHPDMNILIHLRTRNPEFGAKDVDTFISDILPYAPQSTFIIAHAAGWGGYDEANDAALNSFIKAINSGKLKKSRVYLDVAAVVIPEEIKPYYPISEEVLNEQTAQFLKRFRTLNIENWVYGSDWAPRENTLEPTHYLNTLIEAGLSEGEAEKLISNTLLFIK